mgnify:FL=1|jgi:two-component system response regulator YesN
MDEITVMLVDDEKLFIENLLSIYDWNSNGFNIVSAASNGKQALKQFQKFHPQVVITDIRMPFMDGIKLIQSIRKQDKTTKIVLLSSYGDFKYAQQAIKEGITNYILKDEMDSEHISELMSEIKNQILMETSKQNIIVQNKALDFFGNISDKLSDIDPAVCEILKSPSCFVILNEDVPLPIDADSLIPPALSLEKVHDLVSEHSFEGFSVEYAFLFERNIVTCVKSSSPHTDWQKDFNIFSQSILRRIYESFGRSFTAFMVSKNIDLREMKKIYYNAKNIFRSKYFLGVGKTYNLLNESISMGEKEIYFDENSFYKVLECENEDKVKEYIKSLYSSVSLPKLNYKGLVLISRNLYHILKSEKKKLPQLTKYFEQERNIKTLMTITDVKSYIQNEYTQLIKAKRDNSYSNLSPEVMRSIKYIQENYQNSSLKIENIAAHVGLSSGRLSVIFKKDTNLTVNEFITNTRIAKAKELLQTESYKVYEIAQMVGYSSSQYFSHLFSAVTGLNPLDFKKGREVH